MLDQQLKTIVVKSYVVRVKSRVEISQNFVAFSKYMNFKVEFTAGYTKSHSLPS